MKYSNPQNYNKVINNLRLNAHGYYVFTDKEHPLAYRSNNTVFFHRHQASLKLGRWITHGEHVHHIDENKLNNKLDNLQILSSRDHAKLHNPTLLRKCHHCSSFFVIRQSKFCSQKCSNEFYGLIGNSLHPTKINWPTPEQMFKLVWEKPTVTIAKNLGVSDKAINKFCKKNQIKKPPRGYWRKVACGIITLDSNNF